MRFARLRAVAAAGVAALAVALLPAASASADHFDAFSLSLDIEEPGGSGDVEALVTDAAELQLSGTNTSGGALADVRYGLDLPDGFAYTSVSGTDPDGPDVTCVARPDAEPDVLCDIGDVADGETVAITVTADTTGRAASTVTGHGFATWDNVPAVYASDTLVLADNTLELADTSGGADDTEVSFTVANTSTGGEMAQNVTVEIHLPDPADTDVAATIANEQSGDATCERPDEADSDASDSATNPHIICQNLTITAQGPLGSVPIGTYPEITVTGLDGSEAIVAEAKGDNTARAAIDYNADGSVASTTMHAPATRAPEANEQPLRRGAATLGVLLNDSGISLPANQFTPVLGEAAWNLNDDTNTGAIEVEWVEGDTTYRFEATSFRNLEDVADYFQDGGINFDTHQHGQTLRPTGPDTIPDLFSQWLVYAEGNLTAIDANGNSAEFTGVGMHAMFRQAALAEEDVLPFQRWADKGPKPARDQLVQYGDEDPDTDTPDIRLPADLNLVDVLFANTPDGSGGCTFNGVAGDSCDPDLGAFVRLMTFADVEAVEGFNASGSDLTTESPADGFGTRFASVSSAALATLGEVVNTAVDTGVNASAKTFATSGDAADPRPAASRVVLARDDVFADSLAASGLANSSGPILFTAGGPDAALDPTVRAEIHRVLPGDDERTVYVVGGTAAVSAQVEETLEDDGYVVRRLAGPTRIETAEEIAGEVRTLNPNASEQLLVRAYGTEGNPTAAWADSINGAPYAAANTIPVVLTTTDELHPAAERALDDTHTTYVVGGEAAVSQAAFEDAPNAERIKGATRLETAIAVARDLFGRTTATDGDHFVLSPGFVELGWAYGLAAAPHAGLNDAPILLTGGTDSASSELPATVRTYLEGLGYSSETVGNAVVSSSIPRDHVLAEALALLQGDA